MFLSISADWPWSDGSRARVIVFEFAAAMPSVGRLAAGVFVEPQERLDRRLDYEVLNWFVDYP